MKIMALPTSKEKIALISIIIGLLVPRYPHYDTHFLHRTLKHIM